MPAVPERAHDAERSEHLHQRSGQLIEARVLERQIEDAAVDAIEPRLVVGFLSERLDGLGARERLLQRDVQVGGSSLGAQVDLVELPAQRADGDPDEGEDGGRDQRERPVPHEHHDQQADGGREVPHDVDQHRRGQPRDAVHVRDGARHQLAGMHRAEEAERHALDVRVEIPANPRDDALADRGHQIGLSVSAEALQHVGAEDDEGDDPEHHEVLLQKDVVHHRLDEPGDQRLGRRDLEGQHAADDEGHPLGAHVRP